LNLREIEKQRIYRGAVITEPDLLVSTNLIDARFRLLDSAQKPLRNRTRLRFHIGTSEIMARVHLMEKDILQPGDTALVQFVLEKETVALKGDRYIVRSYSPQITIGGGSVIDPYPERFRKRQKEHVPLLIELERAQGKDAVEAILKGKRPHLRTLRELSRTSNLAPGTVERFLKELLASGKVVEAKGRFVHGEVVSRWEKALEDEAERYFKENPYRVEVPVSVLKNALAGVVEPDGVDFVLSRMEESGKVRISGESVRFSGRKIEMSDADRELSSALLELFTKNLFKPPSLDEAALTLKRRPEELKGVFTALKQLGELVEVKKGMAFHRKAVEDARKAILAHFENNPDLTVSEFRQLIGTSRKYALPLLDYFDVRGLTRRVGDKRIKGRG